VAQLKAMNGHTTYNIFKRWQSVIHETFTQFVIPRPHTLPMVYEFANEPPFPSSSLSPRLACIPNGKAQTKAKMSRLQFSIFVAMGHEMVQDTNINQYHHR
jgi:hypothetical protein